MDLLRAQADEAAALLHVNQRGRRNAEATLLLVAVLSLLVTVAALVLDRPIAFLPLAPAVLVLTSLAFQQYADVTVIGVARLQLERSLNAALGGSALLYETQVTGIRKSLPLVLGVWVLQGLTWVAVASVTVTGAVIAAGETTWVRFVFFAATTVAASSCVISFREMRRARTVATERLGLQEA